MTDYFSLEKSNERERAISSILGSGILESKSMKRLRGVSFLGVLNIVTDMPETARFSRYDHSVSVAYLTWYYCKFLGIPEEITLSVTLLALIHDIGHPPFSHSTEIYLQIRAKNQFTHTTVLTLGKIEEVLKDSIASLPRPLKKLGLTGLATRLYELFERTGREKYHPGIVEMFDTPFCPDTFDGINRAWYALNMQKPRSRLEAHGLTCLDALDPMKLLHIVCSSKHHSFLYNSVIPPDESNLIFKFHNLMQALYNDVIYSPWQSSAMVMFARSLELAYADTKGFEPSKKNDVSVIKKIEKNSESARLYKSLVAGKEFFQLSEKNPDLYKFVLKIFEQEKTKRKSYVETESDLLAKKLIENYMVSKLKLDPNLVFCHIFKPLIWSRENVWFRELDKNLWLLKWEPFEGTPSRESKIEVYYTTLL